MTPNQAMLPRSSLLSCRVRLIPCLLADLVGLLARFMFVPGLRQRVAEAWKMEQYNAGAGVYDTQVRVWGKVVDQNGKPVEGAAIAAFVTTLRMIKVKDAYREFSILTTRTAADGTFKLEGAAGFSLTIELLSKDG